jgi:protein-S-isoprenylcysteine O-methyltransferase Ste14
MVVGAGIRVGAGGCPDRPRIPFHLFRVQEISYGASTIQIAEGQTVISTGPYALVRHPMYAGALVMLVGIPLALGSWWVLFAFLLILPVLIWRAPRRGTIPETEPSGLHDYQTKVKYRLLPFVW